MPYYRPIKTIASVAGLPGAGNGGGSVTIVSNTEPVTRDNGSDLRTGDFWYNPNKDLTYIYIDDEWQIIGSNVDYGGDFIIDGGDSLGNGFIDNNPGSGAGGIIGDTSDLPLAFNNNPFNLNDADLKLTDLPDHTGLEYQSDANTWFLASILLHHQDLETIEKEIEDLNKYGSKHEFEALAPITLERNDHKVIHGFDMNNLSTLS